MLRAAAITVSQNRMLAEPAAIYSFIGLEGALRLLCRNRVNKKQFELKPTLEFIGTAFSRTPGYQWMVEDAYKQRNQLAHPDNFLPDSWMPDVWTIDYLYAYAMSIDFFYLALTGDLLPRCDD